MAIACPVCDAGRVRRKLHKDGTDILECEACRLAFWRPDPTFACEGLYTGDYFEGTAGSGYDDYRLLAPALRRSFDDRIGRIPLAAPGARLLDVGAAYGFAVEQALARGWDACGVEVSVEAARRAADHCPGRTIAASALELPFASETFDALSMWDVIEHLADPVRAVEEVARVLRPGGRFVLSTGDVGSLVARLSGARWHLYTLPEHLFFFSRPSLEILISRAGLRVESMVARGSHYPLGYLWERLRKTLSGRARGTVGAGGAIAGLALPINLYDIVTVTAVR